MKQSHKNYRRIFLLLALCCTATLAAPAFAQDAGAPVQASSTPAAPSDANAQPVTIAANDAPIVQDAAPVNEPQREAEPVILNNYVETGGDYLPLTDHLGYWKGGYARTSITKGSHVLNAEINGQSEYGDSGVYFDAGDTFTISSSWYGSISAGSSIGGFFWPRFRTDEFINKKWLKQKQWITTFGFGYNEAKDPHRDHSFYVGSTYYFQRPWILDTGIRFNVSNPGSVFSPAGFVAVTQGTNYHHYITVRIGAGEEAYQLIGPTATLSDFKSQTVTVTYRKWIGQHWGINFVGDYYHNPFYLRGGPSLGIFKDF
jgi:YaiO family outer membrane protein